MSDEDKLERAIQALEAQRAALGDSVVDTATVELREKLAALRALTSDERQLVTVLFADVSGFTDLSERHDPEEIQALLGRLWRRLDRVLLAHRGSIDKHIGDAVMAVWGLRGASEGDAVDAVRAGLALQAELDAFRRDERVELGMRVGVNTGLASVSRVESTGESNVIGDTVNVASRLEHAAGVGTVLIGSVTAEHARERFVLDALEPLELKGKRERVPAYLVVRERGATAVGRSHPGIELPLVGRSAELAALLAAAREASGGGSTCVTVHGEGGTGKSRLLSELCRELPAEMTLLRAAARRETRSTPLSVLRALLGELADLEGPTSTAPFRQRLLGQLSGTLGPERGGEATLHLIALLGLSDRDDEARLEPLRHRPEQIRGRAEVLLREHLQGLGGSGGVVLLLDDLHWADEESLAFFRDLARAKLARWCVLASARASELGAGWLGPDEHRVLELEPLEPELALELPRAVAPAISPELARALVDRSGGNPLFLIELARWAATRTGASDEVPPRIEQLVYQRIQRLSNGARAVIGAAAVIGPSFLPDELEAAFGSAVPTAVLDELVQTGFVLPESGFTSPLLADVAHEFSLLRDRRRWHERFAHFLATTRADDPALVARHLVAANRGADACAWYAAAGDQARRADAPRASLEAYRAALSLLETTPPGDGKLARSLRLRCHEGIGRVFESQARYLESIEAHERALDAARAADDKAAQARIHNAMSWALSQEGRHDAAERSAAQAEAFARSAGADRQLAEALHNRGWALAMSGDADGADALGKAALEVALKSGGKREQALAENLIGVVRYHLRDRFDEGQAHQQAALALYRELGDRWGIACQLNNLGDLARARGDLTTAERLLEEGLQTTREIGHRGQEVILLGNLGRVLLARGDPAAAENALKRSIALAGASGAGSFTLSESLCALAQAVAVQGRTAEALRFAEDALARALPDDADAAVAWRTLGKLLATTVSPRGTWIELSPLVREGRTIDAEECFARSLRIFVDLELSAEQAATYEAWAAFEEQRGSLDRASELRRQAREKRRPARTRPL